MDPALLLWPHSPCCLCAHCGLCFDENVSVTYGTGQHMSIDFSFYQVSILISKVHKDFVTCTHNCDISNNLLVFINGLFSDSAGESVTGQQQIRTRPCVGVRYPEYQGRAELPLADIQGPT